MTDARADSNWAHHGMNHNLEKVGVPSHYSHYGHNTDDVHIQIQVDIHCIGFYHTSSTFLIAREFYTTTNKADSTPPKQT